MKLIRGGKQKTFKLIWEEKQKLLNHIWGGKQKEWNSFEEENKRYWTTFEMENKRHRALFEEENTRFIFDEEDKMQWTPIWIHSSLAEWVEHERKWQVRLFYYARVKLDIDKLELVSKLWGESAVCQLFFFLVAKNE